MKISEIFYSLQGEGMYIGTPSIFIRSSGCNLRCGWCDSPYASWWTEGESKESCEIIEEIYEKFEWIKHVVVTGGEPLIHKDMSILIKMLSDDQRFVTIETNGTIFRDDIKPDLYSISPKTKNSVPSQELHPAQCDNWEKGRDLHIANNTLDNLPLFVDSGIPLQIKFVVRNDEDVQEVISIVNRYDLPADCIYLMPEGFTKSDQEKRSVEIAELCKKEGFILCPRLQIFLWGTKRGV